jgi:hypothetical protein
MSVHISRESINPGNCGKTLIKLSRILKMMPTSSCSVNSVSTSCDGCHVRLFLCRSVSSLPGPDHHPISICHRNPTLLICGIVSFGVPSNRRNRITIGTASAPLPVFHAASVSCAYAPGRPPLLTIHHERPTSAPCRSMQVLRQGVQAAGTSGASYPNP